MDRNENSSFQLALIIITIIASERTHQEKSNGVIGVKELRLLHKIFHVTIQRPFFKMVEGDNTDNADLQIKALLV